MSKLARARRFVGAHFHELEVLIPSLPEEEIAGPPSELTVGSVAAWAAWQVWKRRNLPPVRQRRAGDATKRVAREGGRPVQWVVDLGHGAPTVSRVAGDALGGAGFDGESSRYRSAFVVERGGVAVEANGLVEQVERLRIGPAPRARLELVGQRDDVAEDVVLVGQN